MEKEVRDAGAHPATIAVLDGRIHIGLKPEQLERLARKEEGLLKLSARDLGHAIAKRRSGGTTVAGTLAAARQAGLEVFATGGIGGVHREESFDVSADLEALARYPMIVVCAGAKAILDLQATMERLDTLGVPVVGYQTDEFPAFYSRQSGLNVSVQAGSADEAAAIARAHWGAGQRSAVLIVAPPPEEAAIPKERVEGWIKTALEAAKKESIRGQQVTPYLLAKVTELSGKETLRANVGLLRNNARIAAEIAKQLQRRSGQLNV